MATDILNIAAEGDRGSAYRTTLVVELAVVPASGVTAFLRHHPARHGGLRRTGLTALAALLLGFVLAG